MKPHRLARGLAWCAFVLGVVGCAPAPVDVELSFPSRETFLYSEFGRLRVYEVDLDMADTDCPAILDDIMATEPVLDSDWTQICEFRAGTVGFSDVPPGPHAYVVQVRDPMNNVILEGCRVAEAYEGAPTVQVQMYPTTEYDDATLGVPLTCATEEDKCRGGC